MNISKEYKFNNEKIKDVYIKTNYIMDNNAEIEVLSIEFENNKSLIIRDSMQQCCEVRHLSTDDNLKDFIETELIKIELKTVESKASTNIVDSMDSIDHEIAFVEFTTTKGFFQLCAHNEHNGYYGGFDIEIIEKDIILGILMSKENLDINLDININYSLYNLLRSDLFRNLNYILDADLRIDIYNNLDDNLNKNLKHNLRINFMDKK